MPDLIDSVARTITREFRKRTRRGSSASTAWVDTQAVVLSEIRTRHVNSALDEPMSDIASRAVFSLAADSLLSVTPTSRSHVPTSNNPAPQIVEAIAAIVEINDEQKGRLGVVLLDAFDRVSPESDALELLDRRLEILYEHERKHLDLLKEYKEEIKFARTMEEDLRRERATFFAQTLRDVSTTLKQADVGDDAAAGWIRELVASYTASLDVSAELAQSAALNQLGDLQHSAGKAKRAVVNHSTEEEG